MKSIAATILFSLASYAYADNYQVMVGATGLTFSPNFVMADAGDTIEFIVVGVLTPQSHLTIATLCH
jgi:plastocyanin